jgi:hypothetical protein
MGGGSPLFLFFFIFVLFWRLVASMEAAVGAL